MLTSDQKIQGPEKAKFILFALICIEQQCHRLYVIEREKDALRGTRTTHLLLSGQMF